MQTLPRQSGRDIVESSSDLGWQLFGIEKRRTRFKRGRYSIFGDRHKEWISSMMMEGDLVDLDASSSARWQRNGDGEGRPQNVGLKVFQGS
jgi:hypothetical protein